MKKSDKQENPWAPRSRPNAPIREWVGGRIRAPFYITEGKPYRPEMIIWLELPDDIIVAFSLEDPKEDALSLGDSLIDAMAAPLAGPPRRPERVRVADAAAAREVKRVLPSAEIVKAPTPELGRVAQMMAQSKPSAKITQEPSYFGNGNIPAAMVQALFEAAANIWQIAPWRKAGDNQLLRVDIPRLGIEGACLSIIGELDESYGFVIFPSLVAHENFHAAAMAFDGGSGPLDLGTTTLHLDFEAGADLPPSMLREAIAHGWPVADARAYPSVGHRDRDGMLRPLNEHDVQVVTACATSLVSLLAKHEDFFTLNMASRPVRESFNAADDLEVRFTAPYEAGDLFAENMQSSDDLSFRYHQRERAQIQAGQSAKISRNDPCPCGSGRKYKKCCLLKDQNQERESSNAESVHVMDERLITAMMGFGARRFGSDWFYKAELDFIDPDDCIELFTAWVAYHFPIKGKPLTHWFMETEQQILSQRERSWLNAQRNSWLSIWEVQAVDPGHGAHIRDLLTDEERNVHDVMLAKTLTKNDALLGRVVDHDGVSYFSGIYPQSLPPLLTDRVIQLARKRLRRKSAVPVDRLREIKTARYLIRCWEEELDEWEQIADTLPRLVNHDGEDLLLTTDYFDFDPACHLEIGRRLSEMDGVVSPEKDDPEPGYAFVRQCAPGEKTTGMGGGPILIGSAFLSDGRLRLETNSVDRADALRQRLEAALGKRIKYRVREHSDPVGMMMDPDYRRTDAGDSKGIDNDEVNQLILEMKRNHYSGWIDEPIPALGGKTPRADARTRAGRERIELLIKSMEHDEERIPPGQRFDFSIMRRDLGLDR